MVFGDSLSASYGIAREAGWVSLLQQALRESHPQYQVINTSVSGETAHGGIQRINQALRQHQPKIVILELGANDALRGLPVTDIEADLSRLIRYLLRNNTKVILLGMQLPPNYGGSYTSKFKAMYPKLARHYRITLVPFMLDGLTSDQFQSDNLHPTAAAQAKILLNILPYLQPLL